MGIFIAHTHSVNKTQKNTNRATLFFNITILANTYLDPEVENREKSA